MTLQVPTNYFRRKALWQPSTFGGADSLRSFTLPKAVFHAFSPEIPCLGHPLGPRIHQHRKSLYPTGCADEKKLLRRRWILEKVFPSRKSDKIKSQ
jgi:hypothetical protein